MLAGMARPTCAACNDPVLGSKLCRVVIGGQAVTLCRTHAARVAAEMPQTFDELRALFPEVPGDESPLARRSVIARRRDDDRRMFPPRPEGRRLGTGRRASDRSP
jgi:hypothetical protein